MDGIMFKINRDDGSFIDQGKGSRSVAYFASVTGRDDWILNASRIILPKRTSSSSKPHFLEEAKVHRPNYSSGPTSSKKHPRCDIASLHDTIIIHL
jgi:hypothetical protein